MATTSSRGLEVRSLLKVTNSSFCLTPEEEDVRYGPLEGFLEEARQRIAIVNDISVEDVVANPAHNPKVDLLWHGWQATYLSSKRGNASRETAQQCVVRKRKFGETLSYEERDEMFGKPMYEKEVVVALMACMVLEAYDHWHSLESVVGKIECDAIQENMINCFAKFFLSILDEEDMVRMFYEERIHEQHLNFYREICLTGRFKSFSSGELGNTKFCHLRESDVYNAYVTYNSGGKFNHLVLLGLPESVKKAELIEKFKSRASQLIKEHRPLKEELRAQVLMELTCLNSFHVTDFLILEAIHGLKLPEISKKYATGITVEDAELFELLSQLAETMFQMTYSVSVRKAQQVTHTEYGVIRPMLHIFKNFKDEVVDVLKIANYERIMGNEHFITQAHILTGLGCSRVADCVPDIPKLSSDGSFSGVYTHKIYQLSNRLAEQLGEDMVGLEHFVFAIAYGSSEENLSECATRPPYSDFFKRLKDCRTCFVQSWRNIDIFTTILERRCRVREFLKLHGAEVMVKLDTDLKSGRVALPCDEDFRV